MRLVRRTNDRHHDEPPPQRRILIVDDDQALMNLVAATLRGPTFEVHTATNGLEALKMFERQAFDLVILDVMMPFVDGFEACRRLREQSDVPIVILTSRDGTDDIVNGFELGADDYVTKPFRPAELVARIEAIMRRVEGYKNRKAPSQVRVGEVEIDALRHRAAVRGQVVNLTPMEFELLYFLAANPGRVFDREELFREVWGYEYVGETNLVDVCVRRLREKVEQVPSKPQLILTVRGVGYKLAEGERRS